MGEIKYYDKLVRDKIPEIIREQGKKAVIEKVEGEEYVKYLKKKLVEEVSEFINDNDPKELADIDEVLVYLEMYYQQKTNISIDNIKITKHRDRGGFEEGLVLKEVREKDGKIKN